MDIFGSVVGLVLLSPLFLVASMLIKSVSKGPVFFRQERVGYMGKTFCLWKFRTYEHNADTTQHEKYVSNLISMSHQGKDAQCQPMKKLDNAPDLIPFANLLRKTCIDEMPQLINVLLGEMSLVGPRPPLTYEVKQYAHWHRKRLHAVPGMTGLWQVSGKNRLTFNEMVRLDIQYAREKSFWSDIKILLKTPLAIASQILDSLQKKRPSTVGQEQCQAVA
jgi:lipopolysaccharide/colanic/teichoic acid biosynthesis glycosyltransferase